MRTILFERDYIMHPAGSCLASFGKTRVLCTVTIETSVPPWLKDRGTGWLSAEYAMIPASTGIRKKREIMKRDGRSTEIQRLIGRSLRAAVDLAKLGPVSLLVDCDVIQADGGTRTAAISGSWVALHDALSVLARQHGHESAEYYLLGQMAAVSVGIVDQQIICDLDYSNDSNAAVDMNVVKLDGQYVELQGTAEQQPFGPEQLSGMLSAADTGIEEIFLRQQEALGL